MHERLSIAVDGTCGAPRHDPMVAASARGHGRGAVGPARSRRALFPH
ncbi:MAG TPA: hypothetical protein VFZ77_23785 [Acidimicrobiales bacterium]